MSDLTRLSDERIIEEYEQARGDVAFYKDSKTKEESEKYFNEVRCELHRRGLVGKPNENFC